jgi:hypothetical protein
LATAKGATTLKGSVAILVVGRAFLRVLEDIVGFVDLFELYLSLSVARIAVRVIIHGLTAKGGFERALVRVPSDA